MGSYRLILLFLLGAVMAAAFLVFDQRWQGRHSIRQPPPPAAPGNEDSGTERDAEREDLPVEVVSEDGAPIDGASVRGATYAEGIPWEAFTDARGRVAVPAGVGVRRVRKPGYCIGRDYERKYDGKVLRFVLSRGIPVDGRVVFADGTPAAGCSIGASDGRWDEDSPLDDPIAADADGRFQIAGVPLFRPFTVRASSPGCCPVSVRRVPVGALAPILITLGEGGTIEGRVLDAQGRPPESVRVAIVLDGEPSPYFVHRPEPPLAWAPVDGSGNFRVAGLPVAGAYTLHAWDEPLFATAGPVVVAPDRVARVNLTLQPTGAIRVRLVRPDATVPPMRAFVAIVAPYRDSWFYVEAEHESDVYVASGLLPLRHEVRVVSWDSLPIRGTVVVEPGRVVEIECVLDRGRPLLVKVADGQGNAITRPGVSLEWPDATPGFGQSPVYSDVDGFRLMRPAATEATLRVDAQGFLPSERKIGPGETEVEVALDRAPHVRFRLSDAPAQDFEPDPDGVYLLPVPRAGEPFRLHVPGKFGSKVDYFTEELVLRDAETIDLGVIHPAARGTLAGRVVAPGGAPVPGALVDLRDPFADEPTWTDKAGVFRFEDRPLVRTRLCVKADGFPDLWTDIDPRWEAAIKLQPGVEVRGRLVDADGVPFPGRKLPFFLVREDGSLDMETYWDAIVDSLGRFRHLLPPGRFQPLYHGPGGSGGRGPGPVVDTRVGPAEIEIRLPWSLKLWH